jgi:hypothetical protein
MTIDVSKGLFFCDGCVVRRDVLLLAAGFNADPDQEDSRVVFKLRDAWRHFDVEDDAVISVTARGDTGYVLGSRGSVFEVPLDTTMTLETIDDKIRDWLIRAAYDYGELTRVRIISDIPYCCGQSGQVYRLKEQKWVSADRGLRSDSGPDLEDIAGSGMDDIYVVGLGGAMQHFDGKGWWSVDLPTNSNLSAIRRNSAGIYYVCGDDGLILTGSGEHWRIVAEAVPDKNYWGLEIFEEEVYLAHGKGIDRLVDGQVRAVPIGLDGKLTFQHLQGCCGQLYSFGTDDLLKFDGVSWSRVLVPVRP